MPKGIYIRTPNENAGKHMIGRKFSEETRCKMSIAKTGKKHPAWKGDEALPNAMHMWIVSIKGKTSFCEHCNTTEDRVYHWSNKDHKYNRNPEDWQRLCVPCHKKYDIKFNLSHHKKQIKICSVDGCYSKHSAKGYCAKHYRMQWEKSKNPINPTT